MYKFELGEVLRDTVTGFQGVAMGRTQYFTDCEHYGLVSQSLKEDGEPKKWQWFDETRLIRVKGKKKIKRELRSLTIPTSGPFPNAPEM